MKDCTVIIPVYNCEASPLRRCLQRVFALGDSFEILVIDDGSTDETPKVLEEMKKQIPSLQVIRQSNTGVSGARNAGIVKATGKWVVFCDADDELDPGALKTNLQTMEQCNADYGYGDFSKIVSGNRETITTEDLHTAEQVLHTMLCRPNQYGAVWGKVYRRQFLQENHLTFNPDLSHAEDTEFLVRVLQKARHVTKLPEIMYTYYIYPSSSAKINQAALHHFRNALEAIHQDVAWEPEGIQRLLYGGKAHPGRRAAGGTDPGCPETLRQIRDGEGQPGGADGTEEQPAAGRLCRREGAAGKITADDRGFPVETGTVL